MPPLQSGIHLYRTPITASKVSPRTVHTILRKSPATNCSYPSYAHSALQALRPLIYNLSRPIKQTPSSRKESSHNLHCRQPPASHPSPLPSSIPPSQSRRDAVTHQCTRFRNATLVLSYGIWNVSHHHFNLAFSSSRRKSYSLSMCTSAIFRTSAACHLPGLPAFDVSQCPNHPS